MREDMEYGCCVYIYIYNQEDGRHMEVSWIGGAPSYHPNFNGIFHEINQKTDISVPPCMEPPISSYNWPWKSQSSHPGDGPKCFTLGDGMWMSHTARNFHGEKKDSSNAGMTLAHNN